MATAFVNFQLPQTIYSQFETMATQLEKPAETLLVETLQAFLVANNTSTERQTSAGTRIHESEPNADTVVFADALDEMDDQSKDLSDLTMNTLSSMTQNSVHQLNGYTSVLSPEPDYVKPNLRDEPFIGMWRDREEMNDSTAWVREMRQSHWGRKA
ncbi:MAG: hypothetical protein AAF639_20595 [Chloroflexota bacterium]